jgi:hypothetical protein
MPTVELATVLLGAEPFKENNANETFRGPVLTSDNETRLAIIKDLNLTQLCNELLAHGLARQFGLPVPDCYLGLANSGVLDTTKAPMTSDGSRLVFVSIDTKVPNITYRIRHADHASKASLFDEIGKWSELGSLYAFDAWIANVDRHPGNLLFGGNDEFWLIDHGHSFTGPNWQINQLDPTSEYHNRLAEWLTMNLSNSQRQDCATKLHDFCDGIRDFDGGPLANKSRIDLLLPAEAVTAMKDFLEKRTGKVFAHACKALGTPVIV